MRVKVCGMTQVQQIEHLPSLGVSFAGFIFYPKSPRFVLRHLTTDIIRKQNSINKVGVFVNASVEHVLQMVDECRLHMVQLHGDETPKYCEKIADYISVVKAFRFSDNDNIEWMIRPYREVCDFFLFDTEGAGYGGTGKKFNWELLNDTVIGKPFFLSGGIHPDDADKLKAFSEDVVAKDLFAIDINSKFELSPGVKDPAKGSGICDRTEIDGLAASDDPGIFDFKPHYKNLFIMDFTVNERGYYGNFGGAFIPEMLYPNVEELRSRYLDIMRETSFLQEYKQLLQDYVGRPTPLYFAGRLSQQIGTKIYLKREDLCHTGAHKINNTVGQILLALKLGKKKIIAETGAGQHGVATATVCALKGVECIVYMGEKDIERQAPNVARMKMLGATVIPATSGSKTLKDATNEAMRHWINNPADTHYIIGSVVGPHPYPDMVARFQSIISQEIRKQLKEKTGSDLPTHVVACVGGGSNAAGAFYHFLDEKMVKLVAVEAAGRGLESGFSAATTQLGKPGVLHGSKSLVMQTADGQVVEPHSISAGLDYPGIGPLHAHLFESGRGIFLSATDQQSLDAGFNLAKLEGIIPALETAHALAVLPEMKLTEKDCVVVCLSGRGDKDLSTYMKAMESGGHE